MRLLRLQKHPPPGGREGSVIVYADPDGALKQVSSEGEVSDLGGPGGGSQPVQVGETPPGAADGDVTPDTVGALYVDTGAGGLYIATGATSADWAIVGGQRGGDDFYPGVSVGQFLTAATAVLSDHFVSSGFGNKLEFQSFGADGGQLLILQLGNAGQFTHAWASDGTYTAPNGIIFPTADPEVAGAWWDDNGVLTKSSG